MRVEGREFYTLMGLFILIMENVMKNLWIVVVLVVSSIALSGCHAKVDIDRPFYHHRR